MEILQERVLIKHKKRCEGELVDSEGRVVGVDRKTEKNECGGQ